MHALLLAASLLAADPRLAPEDRSQALRWLDDSQKDFLAAIDGLSEAQWKWKPAPNRWSVGEVAEHVVLAESALFATARKTLTVPANPAWEEATKGKTARLEAILAPRIGKAQAPESIVPQGGLTLAEVQERFAKQRVEIVQFTKETGASLKEHIIDNPFFGPLNGYHWLIYGPLHTMRHTKQIAEVKAAVGYPR